MDADAASPAPEATPPRCKGGTIDLGNGHLCTVIHKPAASDPTTVVRNFLRAAEQRGMDVHRAEAAVAALSAERTRDTERLDWLDARREAIEEVRTVGRQVGDDEWEPEQVRELLGYRWHGIEGQCETIRDAIDTAARDALATPVEVRRA